MSAANPELPPAIARQRLFILACWYALVVLFLLQNLFNPGLTLAGAFLVWSVQVLPLLFFIRGLHNTRLRIYGWFSFAILLYFIHGVMIAFIPERMLWGIAEVLLCSALFCGLVLFIRGYRKHFNVSL